MGSLTRRPVWLSLMLAAATSAVLARTSPVRADDVVTGTSSPDAIREREHVVAVWMDRGHAELLVRRSVQNTGPQADQAVFQLDLPKGAVATGLRSLGVKAGKPFWFQAELTEAKAAESRYRSLPAGDMLPSDAKDPALLAWKLQGLLSLHVFPVAPREIKTVEYTLKIPTSYAAGRFRLKLPRMGSKTLAADAVVLPAHAEDALFIDNAKVEPGAQIKLRNDDGIEIALAQGAQPPLDGALATVPLAKDRTLLSYRFEAGARVSEVPRRANVVVLLDASRSLSQEEADAAKAAAGAYLSHFTDANVEIITFNRRARELFGGLQPVSKATLELEKLAIERGNGSEIGEALAKADARLAKTRPGSARRIVLFTDLKTRLDLSPELARRSLSRSGALLHIALLHQGRPSLARDEEHAWDAVARPTGGLLWFAGVSAELHDRAAQARVYEELARPLRIDHLKVSGPGLAAEDTDLLPATLNEGQGLGDLRIAVKQVPWIEVKGELWATPIRKVARAGDAEGRLWSALVFGSDVFHQLEPSEMMPLAQRGRVVSPVTSFLSVGPGARPAAENEGFGEGFGTSGHGIRGVGGGGIGHGFGAGSAEPARYLQEALEKSWKACGGGDRPIQVDLETTLREIAEVKLTRKGPAAVVAEACLEEAAWALDLPLLFAQHPWMSASLTL